MRKVVFFIVLFYALSCHSQVFKKDSLTKAILDFQKALNEQYVDSSDSPLSRERRLKFTQHDFFPVDLEFCVEAKLLRTPNEKTFEMTTTTDRKPYYVKYGELHFKIKEEKFKLNVYQSMDLLNNPEYRDYLFLPFKDLTSGNESYGGGRFIDLKLPKNDKLIVDFNQAYNPYCAYNHAYSCPVPPPENFLNVEIKAGVKAPKE